MNKFDEIICSSHIISHITQLKHYYPELNIPQKLQNLNYDDLLELHKNVRNEVKIINANQKLSHLFKIMVVCIERIYVVIMKDKTKFSLIQNIQLEDPESIKTVGVEIVQNFKKDFSGFNVSSMHKHKILEMVDKFLRILEGSNENLGARECDIFMEIW